MNLNGGYIMLDLDDTSNLLARVQAVFASGKPLVIKKDDLMQFSCYYRKDANSDYHIATANGDLYTINRFSGQLSKSVTTPIYKHNVVISGTMGVNKKITYSYNSINANSVTSATVIGRIIAENGNTTEDSAILVSDSINQFANVYVDIYQGAVRLHIKPNGATQWTQVNMQDLTATDTVTQN